MVTLIQADRDSIVVDTASNPVEAREVRAASSLFTVEKNLSMTASS